jgi:hypothetical protein
MRRSAQPIGALITLAALSGCGPQLVSLREDIPVTLTPSGAIPLEVVTHSAAVREPLLVDGASAGFTGLEEALGHAISTAAVPWADAHRSAGEAWQLNVELTRARAAMDRGRIHVALDVRATLRTRADRRYLAQTQAHCQEAQVAAPGQAVPVFHACLMSVGRELAGWLGAVQP